MAPKRSQGGNPVGLRPRALFPVDRWPLWSPMALRLLEYEELSLRWLIDSTYAGHHQEDRHDRGGVRCSSRHGRPSRAGDRNRRTGPLRLGRTHPGRTRPTLDRERPMTTISDSAAQAAIGAGARELYLPTVPTEAARLADIAVRERHTHLGYLAEVLSCEVDDRAGRRRTRRITKAKSPRLKRGTAKAPLLSCCWNGSAVGRCGCVTPRRLPFEFVIARIA